MKFVAKAYNATITALSGLAAAIIVFVTFGVSADVLMRALFDFPISWMFEITEYSLFWIPCLGMAWLARERGHVAIDILTNQFSPEVRAVTDRIVAVIVSMILAIVTVASVVVVTQSFRRGALLENTLQIPEAWLLIVIPIGFGLATIEFARQAILGVPERRDLDPSEMY